MSTSQVWIWLLHSLLLLCNNFAESQSIVNSLPGYPGPLPFKFETGYIGVGENDEQQLFYYFVESENNPREDPLLIWHVDGPGCSGLVGLFYSIGPLSFDVSNGFDGSLPSILRNPHSWTKIANIIFIDWPVGCGFSYYNNSCQDYVPSDTKAARDNYAFLRKWLLIHPKFINSRLYIGGDSYGGKIAPLLAYEILQGNAAGLRPQLFLQGCIMGNPVATSLHFNDNQQIPYAHRMGFISDAYYKAAKVSCDGEYVNPAPNNWECLYALRVVQECINGLSDSNILEPKCSSNDRVPKADELLWSPTVSYPADHLYLRSNEKENTCFVQNHAQADVWAKKPSVQEALHTRKGTLKSSWRTCKLDLEYRRNVESAIPYLELLSKNLTDDIQVLVYSGDHDMTVPYLATLKWIRNLNLTMDEDWRPWIVRGQVAGYTERYKSKQFSITFATVKGAGHIAPFYNPKECQAMVDRWFDLYPL